MPKVPPRKAEPSKPTDASSFAWKTMHVKVPVVKGVPRRIEAKVLGPVAVHREIVAGQEWVVTAIAIGYVLCMVGTERDAAKIAVVLVRACADALGKDNPGVIKKALPPWVEPWLRSCRTVGVYRDPAVFQGVRKRKKRRVL